MFFPCITCRAESAGGMKMQGKRRVYPSERKPAKWVSYSLLFLSAVILFSGVAARSGDDAVIQTVATPSPIPLDAAFDETRETQEITLNGSVWYALQVGRVRNGRSCLSAGRAISASGEPPGMYGRTSATVCWLPSTLKKKMPRRCGSNSGSSTMWTAICMRSAYRLFLCE